MSTFASQVLGTPARRRSDAWRRSLQRWFAPRPPKARVEWQGASTTDGAPAGPSLRLAQLAEGGPQDLALWRERGWFHDSQAVLVLGSQERHLLTLDRPDVPEAELKSALRFPLAEALEREPSAVLASALPLPRINAAQRAQVLAVGCTVEAARAHLQTLARARIKLRQIDIIDSALRGMVMLEQGARPDPATHHEGWVVLAHLGPALGVGLVWRQAFCAVRTLPLPQRAPRDSQEFHEQLALHVQRTVDTFERTANELAIRQLRLHLPGLGFDFATTLGQALPLTPQPLDLSQALSMDAITQEHLGENPLLGALACVAAARLVDGRAAVLAPHPTPSGDGGAAQERAA
jgi:hypothetical protein